MEEKTELELRLDDKAFEEMREELTKNEEMGNYIQRKGNFSWGYL